MPKKNCDCIVDTKDPSKNKRCKNCRDKRMHELFGDETKNNNLDVLNTLHIKKDEA